MPTYYNGNMPIFPQRSISDFIHPTKGLGNYSNWSLNSRVQLLQGTPLEQHLPGDGNEPYGVQMSRWFRGTGLDEKQPLSNPGGGVTSVYGHFTPSIWKGLPSSEALHGSDGHLPYRSTVYSWYSNYIYDGLGAQNEPLAGAGHFPYQLGDVRAAKGFGRTDPLDPQAHAITDNGALENPGNNNSTSYGNFKPKEWRGLPSAKAL